MKAVAGADFTVTDSSAPVRYHFSRAARLVAQDIPLGLGAAGERVLDGRESPLLRLGEDREPELVGPRGPLAENLRLRTEVLNDGRTAVIRTDARGPRGGRRPVSWSTPRAGACWRSTSPCRASAPDAPASWCGSSTSRPGRPCDWATTASPWVVRSTTG